MANAQFILQQALMTYIVDTLGPALQIKEELQSFIIENELTKLSIDKQTGALQIWEYKNELITNQEIRPNFWRPPTDNDLGNGMHEWAKIWKQATEECTSTLIEKPVLISEGVYFRIHYELEDLSPLISLAEMYDSHIRVLHLNEKEKLDEEQNQNKKRLISFLINVKHSFHTLSNTDFEESLNCFTQSRGNIDMIAMISKHYSFFQK